MQFDGTGDGVHLATEHADFNFGTGDFTIDCWANFSATAASYYIFETGTYTTGISWIWSSGGYWNVYISNGSKAITNSTTNNADWAPTTGQWYHLALQRRKVSSDAARLSIFVDGIEFCQATSALALGSVSSATHGTSIGSEATTPGANSMNGYIDNFRVSNVARYRGNFTPPGAAYPLTGLFSKDSAGTEYMLTPA